MRALILSDGKIGHENQSKDFCKYLDIDYEIVHVYYKNKLLKAFSYLLDKLKIYLKIFHSKEFKGDFTHILATGSSTYYPAIFFAKRFNLKAIALMYPSGYSLKHFYHVFAMLHDNPKDDKNITILPVNITYTKTPNIYNPNKKSIGIIIGGENSVFKMDEDMIHTTLQTIKDEHKNYEIAITSSPRTPKKIEKIIQNMGFDFEVIFSKDKRNPIGDFLSKCEKVYITEDSTSMISSSVTFGDANICIIKLNSTKQNNKYRNLTTNLSKKGYVYFFNAKPIKTKKLDLYDTFKKVKL